MCLTAFYFLVEKILFAPDEKIAGVVGLRGGGRGGAVWVPLSLNNAFECTIMSGFMIFFVSRNAADPSFPSSEINLLCGVGFNERFTGETNMIVIDTSVPQFKIE